MNYDDIKKLINEMGIANIDELQVEFPEGMKICMKKNTKQVQTVENITPDKHIEEINNNEEKIEENYKIVSSPMVGTFYESSSPNAKPFVKVGDVVKKGQVICIIESMKLMNEIESEYDGKIVQICVKNEDIVDYGKMLFKIK